MKKSKGVFAQKLESLFQTVTKPDGSQYTEVEVEVAAAKMGYKLTNSYIRKLRDGSSQNPSYEKIIVLAKFFKVSPAYFFEEIKEPPPPTPPPLSLDTLDFQAMALRAEDIEDEAAKETMLHMLMAIKGAREQAQQAQDEEEDIHEGEG